jgi:hypothetical protein
LNELDLVREAGFDTVRLPVEWRRAGFGGVDHAVEGALRRGREVIVGVHHFDEGPDALLHSTAERSVCQPEAYKPITRPIPPPSMPAEPRFVSPRRAN